MRWLVLGLLVWCVVAVVVGLLAGPWLRHAERKLGPPKGGMR